MSQSKPRILLVGGSYRSLVVLEHLLERGERVVAFIGQEAGGERDFCTEILEICNRASIPARSGRKFGEEMVRWLEDRIRPELAIAVGISTEIPVAIGGNTRLGLLEVVQTQPPGGRPGISLRQRGQLVSELGLEPTASLTEPDELHAALVETTLEALDDFLDRFSVSVPDPERTVPYELPEPYAGFRPGDPGSGAEDEVRWLEQEFADYTGADAVFAVRSAGEAFEHLFRALGLRESDEVVCPALLSGSALEGIRRTGARAVFVDVREGRLTLDPTKLEAAISPRSRALVATHAFGQPAELDLLYELAEKHGLELVEDAGASLGARFGASRLGRSPCACGFRLPPSLGDAALLALPAALAARLGETLRGLALAQESAALARRWLARLDDSISARRSNAAVYSAELGRYDAFRIPPTPDDALPVYASYVLRLTRFARASADDLAKLLGESGIETRRLALHVAERELVMLPAAEAARSSGLLLPIAEGLRTEQIERVLEAIFDYAIG